MCFPPGARPPDLPLDLRPIGGGAGGEDVVLTSKDGAKFRAFLASAKGDAGVVIAPDVRGLHRFYEELAERFASAGANAMAVDSLGAAAGAEGLPPDLPFPAGLASAPPPSGPLPASAPGV